MINIYVYKDFKRTKRSVCFDVTITKDNINIIFHDTSTIQVNIEKNHQRPNM